MAGRGADEGWRKPAGSGQAAASRRAPGSTVPGTEKPRWSAERRRAPATVRAHKEWLRRSALHPLACCGGRKKDDGLPGAANNTGADVCADDKEAKRRDNRG